MSLETCIEYAEDVIAEHEERYGDAYERYVTQRADMRCEVTSAKAELARLRRIEAAARGLLDRISDMTTEEFRLGGERDEREALRAALESTT